MFNQIPILSSVTANSISPSFSVAGWQTVVMSVTVSGTSASNGFTLSFPCSTIFSPIISATQPVFSSNPSTTNSWAYSFFNDQSSGVNYQGNTGVLFDGGSTGLNNGTYQFLLTVRGLTWVGAQVSNYVAGTLVSVVATQSVLTGV